MRNKTLYAVFLIFALLFLLTIHMSPYPLDYLAQFFITFGSLNPERAVS